MTICWNLSINDVSDGPIGISDSLFDYSCVLSSDADNATSNVVLENAIGLSSIASLFLKASVII